MKEHPYKIWETIDYVKYIVDTTKKRTGWRTEEILTQLDIAPSTYYRVLRMSELNITSRKRNIYQILPDERDKIIKYALENPNPRHRELAWKMVDAGIVCVSPSTVYRVLNDAGLICKWPKVTTDEEESTMPRIERAKIPDEKWLLDFTYVKINERWWYLLYFIDEYSRYVPYHELLPSMDANTVNFALQKALEKDHAREIMPVVQTDNAPCFVSREFKRYLSHKEIAHHRIYPHTPEQNAIVERGIRTLKELAGSEFDGYLEAVSKMAEMVDYYNNERYHSSLHYLRPIDYYRGEPIKLLEIRKERLKAARELRRQINIGIKQITFCSNTHKEVEMICA